MRAERGEELGSVQRFDIEPVAALFRRHPEHDSAPVLGLNLSVPAVHVGVWNGAQYVGEQRFTVRGAGCFKTIRP